jgi:hypothetical protein
MRDHAHVFWLILLNCFTDKQFVGVLMVLSRLAASWLTRRWNLGKQKLLRQQFTLKECFSLIWSIELWFGNFPIKLISSFKKQEKHETKTKSLRRRRRGH